MSEPDWEDQTLVHSIRVDLVDPVTLSQSRGALSGVVATGKLSLQYYSDTRASASVTTSVAAGESDGWDGTAAMRIVHVVGDWSETLFTGYVTACPWEEQSGQVETTYTLNSTMWAMGQQVVANAYTIGSKGKGLDALRTAFRRTSRTYSVAGSALDHVYARATVYEGSKTWLSVAHDVANTCGDRLDVAPDGRVTVSRYVAPASRTPRYDLALDDADGPFFGSVSGEDSRADVPGRVVVISTDGDDTVVGTATVSTSSAYHPGRRGWTLDMLVEESDLDPFTAEAATALARKRLALNSAPAYSMDVDMLYRPLAAGDVLRIERDGEVGRWAVSTATLDLHYFTWSLELKEV